MHDRHPRVPAIGTITVACGSGASELGGGDEHALKRDDAGADDDAVLRRRTSRVSSGFELR